MEQLQSIGIFFGGLGLMMISFALFWIASIHAKKCATEKPSYESDGT